MAMVTQMKIGGVMRFYNEEEYLRDSLSRLKTIPFDGLVCALDRCTDNGEQIIRNLNPLNSRIVYKRKQRWTYRFAETFQTSFDELKMTLYSSGSDVITFLRCRD